MPAPEADKISVFHPQPTFGTIGHLVSHLLGINVAALIIDWGAV